MATNRLYTMTGITMPPLDILPGSSAAGGTAKSGVPVVCGQIPGVLVNDAVSDGRGVMAIDGIFTLSVKGENQGGNTAVAEGDILYMDVTKAYLSKDTTKVRYGYALQAVASGSTASIPVKLGY